MGILDGSFDPQTQGLLAAAFQGLQSSGPSRMPMSLGQIIGQGGSAGMSTYAQAIKEARAQAQAQQLIELEKQKAELTKAQIEQMRAKTNMLSGLSGTNMSDPVQVRAAALRMYAVDPAHAGVLMTQAQHLEDRLQESQTLNSMRPQQGLINEVPTQGVINGVAATRFNVPQNDPMIQPPGATEPIPQSVAGMGKTPFVANPTQTSQLLPPPAVGGLLGSTAPGVAPAAGGLIQQLSNPAFNPKSSYVTGEIEKLRAADSAAQNAALARQDMAQRQQDNIAMSASNAALARQDMAQRQQDNIAMSASLRPEPAPNVHVVQDPKSNTGWSYKNFRDGSLTPDAPPPSSINIDKRQQNVRGNMISRDFDTNSKPIIQSLNNANRYDSVRATGDLAQASVVAKDILVAAVRGGSSRLRSDVNSLIGGTSGGNVISQIENWVSKEFSKGGGPTKETMAKLDKIIAASKEADLQNLASAYKRSAAKVGGVSGLSIKETLGLPFVQGNSVVFPDGTYAKFSDNNKAADAAQSWVDNNK